MTDRAASADAPVRPAEVRPAPGTWCVQSRKTMHLRGLATFTCKRIDAHEQRARDIANDRGNEDQRGR